MRETNKLDTYFGWWIHPASPASPHRGENIENSLSDPQSPGLLWRRSPAKIAARWHYRLPIKSPHYKGQFCVSFHFCVDQKAHIRLQTYLNESKHIYLI